MRIENMPGCCTSAILWSFGEHGEPSEVTVPKIKELVSTMKEPVIENHWGRNIVVDNAKRCIFAISVDDKNVNLLLKAGFKIVDQYEGIQGRVRILTLHI